MMGRTYKVIRFYFNGIQPFTSQKRSQRTIKRGLTLDEARKYCALPRKEKKSKAGGFCFDGWAVE